MNDKPQQQQPQQQEIILPTPNAGMPTPQSLELTKLMIKDDTFILDDDGNILEGDIPADMLHYFWGFLSKDTRLTKKEKKDVDADMMGYKAAEAAYIMATPRSQFSMKTLFNLQNLERKVYDAALRSVDGFEREMETRQTTASLYGELGAQRGQQQGRSWWNPFSMIFGR